MYVHIGANFILLQISNALVKICMANIQAYCTRCDEKDEFWNILSSVIEAKVKLHQTQKEHPFLTLLSLCLQVHIDTLHLLTVNNWLFLLTNTTTGYNIRQK